MPNYGSQSIPRIAKSNVYRGQLDKMNEASVHQKRWVLNIVSQRAHARAAGGQVLLSLMAVWGQCYYISLFFKRSGISGFYMKSLDS